MQDAKIRESDMASVLSWEPGLARQLAIHLPGLPNLPVPIPGITEFLVGEAYFVLQPHYAGTYDSGGYFEPEESHRAVSFWCQKASSGPLFDWKTQQEIQVPSTLEFLSSHSFGTYVAMNAILAGSAPARAIFFAPMFEFGDKARDAGLLVDLDKHARHIENGWPLSFRLKAPGDLQRFFRGGRHVAQSSQNQRPVEILLICGDKDEGVCATNALKAAIEFCRHYPDLLKIRGALVSKGAGHSVQSMLNDNIKSSIRRFISGGDVGLEVEV